MRILSEFHLFRLFFRRFFDAYCYQVKIKLSPCRWRIPVALVDVFHTLVQILFILETIEQEKSVSERNKQILHSPYGTPILAVLCATIIARNIGYFGDY